MWIGEETVTIIEGLVILQDTIEKGKIRKESDKKKRWIMRTIGIKDRII